MEGTRPVVEYNRNKFLVTKRNYITTRRETQKWEAEGGDELLFFLTTAFQKGPDRRENFREGDAVAPMSKCRQKE